MSKKGRNNVIFVKDHLMERLCILADITQESGEMRCAIHFAPVCNSGNEIRTVAVVQIQAVECRRSDAVDDVHIERLDSLCKRLVLYPLITM